MLRKLIIATIVANFVFILVSVVVTRDNVLTPTFALNTSISGPVHARVEGILELISGGIKQIPANATGDINPWLYPNSTTGFEFGTLQFLPAPNSYFIGQYWYCTLMIPVTSGRPFKITETGTTLLGTNGTIPDTAFVQIPDYNWDDVLGNATQEGPPTGAYLGDPSSAVGTHDVYVDPAPGGVSKIIRGIIAIPQAPGVAPYKPFNYERGYDGSAPQGDQQVYDAWVPAGVNTPPGDYSGTVTFTLNLI